MILAWVTWLEFTSLNEREGILKGNGAEGRTGEKKEIKTESGRTEKGE